MNTSKPPIDAAGAPAAPSPLNPATPRPLAGIGNDIMSVTDFLAANGYAKRRSYKPRRFSSGKRHWGYWA